MIKDQEQKKAFVYVKEKIRDRIWNEYGHDAWNRTAEIVWDKIWEQLKFQTGLQLKRVRDQIESEISTGVRRDFTQR